jgi:hypothetical protein
MPTMSKTILANVDGFTPLIDDIVDCHGVMVAAVFGRVWRYCQMSDGICRAKIETLASELNLDRTTIMRHLDTLVENGYLEDTTPYLRNRPHIYFDTGKAQIHVNIGVGNSDSKRRNGVGNSDSHSRKLRLEDSI